jgi:hypothetical protein
MPTAMDAIKLARLGLSVIPVASDANGKRALTKWKPYQERRATEDEIRRWWRRWPEAAVGIVTGPISGVVVVDIDPRHGGDKAWRDLIWRHGSPEWTWRAFTPSSGEHWYFRLPQGASWRNTAGIIGPGIDSRAAGGLVLAPPSVRHDGRSYVWAYGGCPFDVSADELAADLADPPPWLAATLDSAGRLTARQTQVPSVPARPIAIKDAYVKRVVESELNRLLDAVDGDRNEALNRTAYALGRFVGPKALDADDVRQRLFHIGCRIGLTKSECLATIASGVSAGMRRPHKVQDE